MVFVTEGNSLTELFETLLNELQTKGKKVGNTLELTNVTDVLYDPFSRFVRNPARKHSLSYLKKEMLWYLGGKYSIEEIAPFAKMWSQVSDDGETVNSNYGAKLFKEKIDPLRTQFDMVVEELRRNPDSRRAVVFFLLPQREYHLMHLTKDFPCTVFAQFLIRDERMHMTVHMRSNDLIFGWCNDMPFFSVVLELMARKCKVEVGSLTHQATSLHIYERHFPIFREWKGAKWDADVVFPKIAATDVNKVLNLKTCRFVTWLKK